MFETQLFTVNNPQKMAQIGHSLAHSLYTVPLDIFLIGSLGAGKTTLLQGVLGAMGVTHGITSPTYALQQEYDTTHHGRVLHIDLYRLDPQAARTFLAQSDDFPGIRCIEWADRAGARPSRPTIRLTIDESPHGRSVLCGYDDADIPSPAIIETWRNDVLLQQHVRDHCDAVAHVAAVLGRRLQEQGVVVRLHLLHAAGRLHDLLRFIDYHGNAGPDGVIETEEERRCWSAWKAQFPGLRHEAACAAFMDTKGYPALSRIIATHGVHIPPGDGATIEQQLLYYSDKRCMGSAVVTIQERFDDFERRYGSSRHAESAEWLNNAKEIERRLFAGKAPTSAEITGAPQPIAP